MMIKKKIFWLIIIVIAIGVASLWFLNLMIPFYYYHGVKTTTQIKQTQVVRTYRNQRFRTLRLAANLPVVVKHGSSNEIKVVAQKRQQVKVKRHNQRLTISSQSDSPVRSFNLWGIHHSNHQLTNSYVEITIKNHRHIRHLIRMNPDLNGDLMLKDVEVEHLILQGSGALNFQQVWSDHQLLINNQRGSINFDRVKATILNLTTSKGTINIKQSHFKKQPSQIISDSSSINLTMDDWNRLWAKTNEGNVTFRNQNSKHLFKVLTSDGNIKGWIDYPSVALINSYSVNGNVHVFKNLPTDWARYYSFYSGNGDINIYRGQKEFPSWVAKTEF